MESKENKALKLQKKSHEALLKVLNNVGIIGAILAALADIAFVIIMVLGIQLNTSVRALVIYAVVNALVGILINVLLRYQGQKYAEIENEELCEKFYNKRVKEKKYMSMGTWMGLKTLQDFIVKGCTTAFSIFGVIYISIEGSKNPIQILLTFGTLVLFACFGLMGMNSAYCRFYNVQVPFMQLKVENDSKTIENNIMEGKTSNTVTNSRSVEMAKKRGDKQANVCFSDIRRANILEPPPNFVGIGHYSEQVVDDSSNSNMSILGRAMDTSSATTDSTGSWTEEELDTIYAETVEEVKKERGNDKC